MRKLGILLLGSLILSGASIAQADSWHGNKNNSGSKGSKGQQASVYGTHHNKKVVIGRDVNYGAQKSQNKKVNKAKSSSKRQTQKVVYVKPKKVVRVQPKKVVYISPKVQTRHYNVFRPKYVYVKPVYTPRYYGYHPYRGYYWPFLNVRFVFDLTPRQIEHHHQAVYSALDAPVGYETTWRDGRRRGSIVIRREGYDSNGNLCKQYRQSLTYRGHVTSSVEESCLSPEGYWVST